MTVTAAAIATINALAPGRTFLGVGSGNTAMRIMGCPPHRIAELDRYLESLRLLLRGEEAFVGGRDGNLPVRHIMPDRGFVNFADPIPLYVSGFAPRSLGLAGRHGDGAVLPMPRNAQVMEALWNLIEAGVAPGAPPLDRSEYYTTALTTMVVLDEGEATDSPRVRRECGAFAMATLHYAYDQWRQLSKPPPSIVAEVWDDYCAMLAKLPEERLHQRIHAGHNCWVIPEEERFVTRDLIESSCLVGSADQLIARLQELDAAGLRQVMILPSFEPRYAVLERVARDVLPHV